jgi:hypothetical protein
MVASTYSDFGGLRANYIFAYTRAADAPITILPSAFGIAGASYLYDYLAGTGRLIPANGSVTFSLNNGIGYFVLTAVGQTGIAFLGDQGQFVTLGKKRIPTLTDTGAVDVTVAFAPATGGVGAEKVRTLFGYSPQAVTAVALNGTIEKPSWDPSTQLFTIRVQASKAGTAHLRIVTALQTSLLNVTGTVCGLRCGSAHPAPVGTKSVGVNETVLGLAK